MNKKSVKKSCKGRSCKGKSKSASSVCTPKSRVLFHAVGPLGALLFIVIFILLFN